jgi:hypothetical protein
MLEPCNVAIVRWSYNQGGDMVDFDDKFDELKNDLAEKKGEVKGRFDQYKQEADSDE